MKSITGVTAERIYVDRGYRGHDYPNKHRVFQSGQKRGVTGTIKKELRRRSLVEPIIGHLKSDGHLGRNYLKGLEGDKLNALLTAAGYNFRLLLKWFRALYFAPVLWLGMLFKFFQKPDNCRREKIGGRLQGYNPNLQL